MLHFSRRWPILFVVFVGVMPAAGQTFPKPEYFHNMVYAPGIPSQVPGPEGLREYVLDGKLRLTLGDAIRLTLLNNTDVRLNELPVEQAKYSLMRAYQPFDPLASLQFNSTRSNSPTYSQLQGAPTLSDLEQQSGLAYKQTLDSGTQYQVNYFANKSSTNNHFFFFNPSIFSSLNFQLTQPLLRNRGRLPNRAPIVLAQRNLKQSRATFEAEVSNSIGQAVGQYWDVVLARENLRVVQKSLEEAEASYKQNKRALELGALPPLEIYRSESEVANRRVSVIQAEYQLKGAEDRFRRAIGADLDPFIRALDLDLVENPEPTGELVSMDVETALKRALARRPELEALRQQLENDETSVRVSHNHLLPDLSLSLLYSSNGLGGNQFNTAVAPPALVSQGGFGDALSQVFGFGFPVYGFGLQLNLPLRNRAAEADLGSALVGRRRSLYLMRQARQAVSLEATNAVHQLEQAKLSIEAAKIARDLSQKNLEAEQRKVELGETNMFFVLQAQTQLAQAEAALVQAEVSYERAVIELDRATGTLLDRYHIQIARVTH